MPRLNNDRHELFAMMRAKGMSLKAAGAAAGFAPGSSTPNDLDKDPEVLVRVQEIMGEMRDKREAARAASTEAAKVVGQMTGVSRAWVLQKLAENAQNAATDGDYKESNSALKLIGDEFGMFKGATAEGAEDSAGVRVFDIDALEAVLQPGMNALAAPAPSETGRDVNPEIALDLIAGNDTAARRARESRAFTTGSETDAALHEDADPDLSDGNWSGPVPQLSPEAQAEADEVEPADGWTQIDPSTAPEDILAMVQGARPIPAFDADAPAPDDRPKRRSSR